MSYNRLLGEALGGQLGRDCARLPRHPHRNRRRRSRPLSRAVQAQEQLTNFLGAKTDEHTENGLARRYYHGAQWDPKALKTLHDRNQPVVTFNRIKRKINTVVGVLEKLRQDPKAYPRSPGPLSEKGAELATQVLLYALGWDWERTSAEVGRQAAVAGIGGVEMVLVQGDKGDPEIELLPVDSRDYFYDVNSQSSISATRDLRARPSWIDLEEAQVTWPDAAEELEEKAPTSAPTPYPRDDDKRLKWWDHDRAPGERIVDHWYKRSGKWLYTIYCGEVILEEGEQPLHDEKGRNHHANIRCLPQTSITTTIATGFRDWRGRRTKSTSAASQALHLDELPAAPSWSAALSMT